MIIWDKIISHKKDAHLRLTNEFVKYALIDQGAELRNRTVALKVLWDHMPVTGRLYWGQDLAAANKNLYTLPEKYKTS